MKKIIILFILATIIFNACAPEPRIIKAPEASEVIVEQAGFWQGLWHGFISLFTFIISLFNKNVEIYESYNNGNWYNFGFIIGVSAFFGGSGSGSSRSRKKDRC